MSIKFVIVGAARTGSTLLVKTLNRIDGVCCHGELLGSKVVRGYEDGFDLVQASPVERHARSTRLFEERARDPIGFISRTLSAPHTANGFKALYSAFLDPEWQSVVTSLLATSDIKFVHLARHNTLRRYVSEQILLEGGPIHSEAGGRSDAAVKVHIDIDAFSARSALIASQEAELRRLLAGQALLDVSYEELSADTAATVQRVCEFLGLARVPSRIEPALQKVGAADLNDTVSNYAELLQHPATRDLAMAD